MESYRQEVISFRQVAELLELSIDETACLLKKRKVLPLYDLEDMRQDSATVERLKHLGY